MKTLTLAAVAAASFAALASTASASDYFSIIPSVENNESFVELPLVRSSGDGVVEIRDDNGVLLGSAAVNAGANADVKLNFDIKPNQDVTAFLIVDGQETAMKDIDVRR